MSTYYSQHGEDYILEKIFSATKKGVFVEIGCIDGRRFSNTLLFEEKGWKGLLVEAHPDYIESLKFNRPNSSIVHAAVGSSDQEKVTFYADRRGSLSSLDPTREKELKRNYAEYFSGFEKRDVQMRTLSSIFNEHNLQEIDLLSIDIEGGEEPALLGLDFNLYKPRVLVVEFDSIADLVNLRKLLKPKGYSLPLILGNNLFFTTDPELFSDISGKKFSNIKLTHTGNKIDKEPDKVNEVTIDTSRYSSLRQVYKIFVHTVKNKVKDILNI